MEEGWTEVLDWFPDPELSKTAPNGALKNNELNEESDPSKELPSIDKGFIV